MSQADPAAHVRLVQAAELARDRAGGYASPRFVDDSVRPRMFGQALCEARAATRLPFSPALASPQPDRFRRGEAFFSRGIISVRDFLDERLKEQ